MSLAKIIIGTVQFGLNYGVTNHEGMVSSFEVKKILDSAASYGLKTIDTARLYGESEDVLGLHHHNRFEIITKFSYVPENSTEEQTKVFVQENLNTSLEKLKISSTKALLVHNVADFLKYPKVILELSEELKKQGKIEQFGVSLYNPEQAKKVLEIFTPDIIQFPMNVFDQTFIESGALELMKKKGVETHIRSVFLQGIILQSAYKLDPFFDFFKPHYLNYEKFLNSNGLSHVMSALKFVLDNPLVDKFLIGVCSQVQLEEILEELQKLSGTPKLDYSPWKFHDQRLINPLSWPMLKK